MSVRSFPLTSMVIASGATATTTPLLLTDYRNGLCMFISGDTAQTGTISVQVKLRGGTTFKTLQDGGVDVTIGVAKTIRVDFPCAFDSIQVLSSSAEGADRTFRVTMVEDV